MEKTYIAKTCVAISVRVRDKGCHISFVPQTLGGSTYTTVDPDVQKAIEGHKKFGKSIKLAESYYQHTPEEEMAEEEAPSVEKVKVSSLAEAKELIAERTQLSRSKLRTKADIENAAAGAGIELVWE